MPRRVFGAYTQEQLDARYDQRSLVPDRNEPALA